MRKKISGYGTPCHGVCCSKVESFQRLRSQDIGIDFEHTTKRVTSGVTKPPGRKIGAPGVSGRNLGPEPRISRVKREFHVRLRPGRLAVSSFIFSDSVEKNKTVAVVD